jgi:hypothetical protein
VVHPAVQRAARPVAVQRAARPVAVQRVAHPAAVRRVVAPTEFVALVAKEPAAWAAAVALRAVPMARPAMQIAVA